MRITEGRVKANYLRMAKHESRNVEELVKACLIELRHNRGYRYADAGTISGGVDYLIRDLLERVGKVQARMKSIADEEKAVLGSAGWE